MKKIKLSKKQILQQRLVQQAEAKHKYLPWFAGICAGIIVVLLVVVIFSSTFSTVRIAGDMTAMENMLTDNGQGILSSDQPIAVTDNTSIKSSYDYMITQGDIMLEDWKNMQELGLFSKNIDGSTLWSIYYTLCITTYQENSGWYTGIANWYDSLEETNTDKITTCKDENCRFIAELSSILNYSIDELINSNAHNVYHAQLDESIAAIELTDADWTSAYEAYLISSPEFIESITLKSTLLIPEVQKHPKLANWAAYGNIHCVRWLLGDIAKIITYTEQEDIKQLLNYIDITQDAQVLSGTIIQYAPNLLLLYGRDELSLDLGDTYIQNITNIEDIDAWLEKQAKSKKQYEDVTTSDKRIDIGCGVLYWDLLSIKHVEELPTFDEMMNNTAWKQETLYAVTEATFWQMVYDQNNVPTVDTSTNNTENSTETGEE